MKTIDDLIRVLMELYCIDVDMEVNENEIDFLKKRVRLENGIELNNIPLGELDEKCIQTIKNNIINDVYGERHKDKEEFYKRLYNIAEKVVNQRNNLIRFQSKCKELMTFWNYDVYRYRNQFPTMQACIWNEVKAVSRNEIDKLYRPTLDGIDDSCFERQRDWDSRK